MKKTKIFIVLSLFMMMFFYSCNYPQPKLDETTIAIQGAKDVGADVYLASDYQVLLDSLTSIETKLEAEKSKLFSNYSDFKKELDNVIQLANDIKIKTEEFKIELKLETEKLIDDSKLLVQEVRVLVEQSPKGKDGKSALDVINSEIDSSEVSITQIEVLLNNGELLDANSKSVSVKEKLSSIKLELENVISKTK